MVVRVVGCTRARPAEQAHHAGGLPIVGVSGRVQLRGRAGVSAQQNSNDPVQQGPEGAVRRVLRAAGHLLAGHLQRMPADGAAELRAVEGHRGGEAAALHPEQVGWLCEGARGEVERNHASGHGGIHAGRVGGARRGPLLLDGRCGEGGGDAAELRGAEVRGRRRQRECSQAILLQSCTCKLPSCHYDPITGKSPICPWASMTTYTENACLKKDEQQKTQHSEQREKYNLV